ncbi:MAG: DUF1194 domain-containing protein [Pseudomonadota bacterium]
MHRGAWRVWAVALSMLAVTMMFTDEARAERVELELVLAIDTSTSVNADEYELQRKGIAEALRHPSVLNAIAGLGEAGMALTIVQWSGSGKQITAVPWTRINSTPTALAFAAGVDRMPRRLKGFTDIGGAIQFSTASLLTNEFDGRRLVIDVSGDGTSDRNDPRIARDAAISQGIVINGLIIHSIDYDLGDLARFDLHQHYLHRVIGGPGAFLLNAESFQTFAESMRDKLVREITGPLLAAR